MFAKNNSGGVVVKTIVVLVLLAAAGVAVFYNVQKTARVKASERDNAVDGVKYSLVNMRAIHSFSPVPRQQGRMDVDDANWKRIDKVSRQQPHKSG
jgi:hypothetical protein